MVENFVEPRSALTRIENAMKLQATPLDPRRIW